MGELNYHLTAQERLEGMKYAEQAERREAAERFEQERANLRLREAFLGRQAVLHQQYAERLIKPTAYTKITGQPLNHTIPTNVPIIPPASIEQTARITAITETMEGLKQNSRVQKLRDKLSILLGTQIFSIPIKARQIFYSPESTLYQQCYWILLNVAQTYFQEIWSLEDEAEAFLLLDKFHEQYLETRELKKIFDGFAITYGEAFPEFKEKANAFSNRLFNGNALRGSLLDAIEEAHQAYYKSAPAMDGLPLLPPAGSGYETSTEPAYTLSTLELLLTAKEKKRYQQLVSDYLKRYPEEANYFKGVFELGDVTMAHEQLAERLSEHSAYLPPDGLGKTLLAKIARCYEPDIEEQLMEHGAELPREDRHIWYRLQRRLFFYPSKNSRDEAFRQQMLAYCQKDHDKERWQVLDQSLQETCHHPTRSLLEVVYEKTVLKKRFYRFSYRLLEIADNCMKLNPEKMAPFFASLPEKIAIFQPSLFEEARNRSFLEFLWFGRTVLAKKATQVAKSETTSEDSFLSDGTCRFEEVDENGAPLNPVADSKRSSDEEDAEEENKSHELMQQNRNQASEYESSFQLMSKTGTISDDALLNFGYDSELERWDAQLREIVRSDAKQYASTHAKNSFLTRQFSHGGTVSLKHSKKLQEYDTEKEDNDKRLYYLLDYLKDHFLHKSISSMGDDSLDTPLVLHLKEFILHSQQSHLHALRDTLENRRVPEETVLTRYQKNTPFHVRYFPKFFKKQYQRSLERTELGLSLEQFITDVGKNYDMMQVLKNTPKTPIEKLALKNYQKTHLLEQYSSQQFQVLQQQLNHQNTLYLGLKSQMDDYVALMMSTQLLMEKLQERMTNTENSQDKLHSMQNLLAETLEAQEKNMAMIQASLSAQAGRSLSPDQATYVRYFKQIVSRVYLAAMVISTGLFKTEASGRFGQASKILEFFAGVTPFAGSGMRILSVLLKVADEITLQRRMNRLLALGSDVIQVIYLAERLALKLIHFEGLRELMEEDKMGQLLSTGVDVVDTLNSHTTVTNTTVQLIQDKVLDKVTDIFTQGQALPPMAELAEEVANKLIERISTGTHVFMVSDQYSEVHLLFYAAPLLAIADELFMKILSLFCVVEQYAVHELACKPAKRQTFQRSVAQAFENHAMEMEERFIDGSKRATFLENMAQRYHTYSPELHTVKSTSKTVGLFYFKEAKKLTLFSGDKKHVSLCNEALSPEVADDFVKAELTK